MRILYRQFTLKVSKNMMEFRKPVSQLSGRVFYFWDEKVLEKKSTKNNGFEA